MTTGSLCLTEILMSRKPCSSNSEHSHSADSTRAAGVARPYLASSRLSREPALTPIRIGTPAAEAARAISPTRSSNFLMFPGLTRTAAQPASIAANTYRGWKWMSAITGICDLAAIAGRAATSSVSGTATRTIWQPAAVSSAICCRVALTSAVFVVHIDWTETGASPPTGTEPTVIRRDGRRSASRATRDAAIPNSLSSELVGNGVDDVGVEQQHRQADEDRDHQVRRGEQLGDVRPARVPAPPQPGDPLPDLLIAQNREMTAVQRQQRQQVEHADEHVEPGDQDQELAQPLGQRARASQRLPAGPGCTDGPDQPGGVPPAVVDSGVEQLRDPGRDAAQRGEGRAHRLTQAHQRTTGHGPRGQPLQPLRRPDAEQAAAGQQGVQSQSADAPHHHHCQRAGPVRPDHRRYVVRPLGHRSAVDGHYAVAGANAGDRIVAIDGRPVTEWSNDVAMMVRAHGAGPLTVVVERGGSRLTLSLIHI